MSYPIKTIRIGQQVFQIAGVSTTDPYFSSVGDDHDPEFDQVCSDFILSDYVCVDVGANIGLKSLLLSQYVPEGRVVAIEAAPIVASILQENVARSGKNNIVVVQSAVGDVDGTVNFQVDSAYGHIASAGVEVPLHKLATIVDELKMERLDFAKIDVEGYEFPILRNSIDLLNRKQSLVLFEFNSWCQIAFCGSNPRDFAEWIVGSFTNIFLVRRGTEKNYLERLPADGSLNLLQVNLVQDGAVTDILVTNFEGRLAHRKDRAQPAPNWEKVAQELIQENDVLRRERDTAVAELAALHHSQSWKLMAPLRALSVVVRRRV